MTLSKFDKKLIAAFNKAADTYEYLIDAIINAQHAENDAKKNEAHGKYIAAKVKSGALHVAAAAVYRATSIIAEAASSKLGTDVNHFSKPRNYSFRKTPDIFETMSEKY